MSTPDTPQRFRLPPRALKLLGIAFAAGLLLFLLVWWEQRDDTDFFTARQANPAADQDDALPIPLPADVATGDEAASGLRVLQGSDTTRPAAPPPPVQIGAPVAPAMPTPATPAARPTVTDRAAPVPLSTPPPRYPAEALRRRIGGSVRVRATVAANGSVQRLDLTQASGNRDLDRAALEAVRRWRFQPAIRNGQPVAADVIVPLDFAPGP
jgi:protein TonB